MKGFFKEHKNQSIRLIRSFILILLSFIVLITSVLAWFLKTKTVTAHGMKVSVGYNQIYVTDDEGNPLYPLTPISIPSATKIDDDEITKNELSQALFIKVLRVYFTNLNEDIDVSCLAKSSDLHYYFDTEYNPDSLTDNALAYAELLKENTNNERDSVNNNGMISHTSTVYTDTETNKTYYKVAVVFYADYINNSVHNYSIEIKVG